jgi:uncharacterized protein (TIGR03905 family)
VTIVKRSFRTRGTCSTAIDIEVEDGIIKDVQFTGGCDGNLKAISRLVAGMRASDAIDRLDGIKCGRKDTSCADQLTKALREMSTDN